jgi:hypothetical protein
MNRVDIDLCCGTLWSFKREDLHVGTGRKLSSGPSGCSIVSLACTSLARELRMTGAGPPVAIVSSLLSRCFVDYAADGHERAVR